MSHEDWRERDIERVLREIKEILKEILHRCFPPKQQVTGFTIQQTGATMTPIAGAGSFYPKNEPPVPTTAVQPTKTVPTSKEKATVALTAPNPGSTLQFTATPTPAGATLPAGVVPVWTSSDTTNVTITTDPTGLIASVVLSTAIPVGESVTLTCTATLPDGTTPNGTAVFTVGSVTPPVEVTGFTILQTA